MNPWSGKLHFEGEPDTFSKIDALMFPARAAQKEDDMHAVSEFVGAYVTTARVLWFVAAMFGAGWLWFAWNNARGQLLECDKETGRPYRAETVDRLERRADLVKRERVLRDINR